MVKILRAKRDLDGMIAGTALRPKEIVPPDTSTPPVTSPGANLLNDAEYGATDLALFGAGGSSGGTVNTLSTDWTVTGTGGTSLRSTFTSGASRGSGPLVAKYIPVTQLCYYKGSVRVKNGNSSMKFRVYLIWYDADKKTISGSPEGNATTIAVGAEGTLTTEITAPLRAAFVRVAVKNDTTARPASGSYYYTDAWEVTQTSFTPKQDTSQYVLSRRKLVEGIFPSASSYWKWDIRDAPVHPDSANLVNHLVNDDVAPQYGGVSVFNTAQYNSTNYIVSADHPRINIGFCDGQRKGYTPGELYNPSSFMAFRNVPVPTSAISGGGGDGHITIFCPETGELWEFWQFWEDRQQDTGYGGVPPINALNNDFGYRTKDVVQKNWKGFSATWGGRIDNVNANPGVFPGATGTSASGLSYADGTISFADLDSGVIDHALAISVTYPRQGLISWPARRTDGSVNSANSLPEGIRLRMKASVNFDALNIHPLAKMVGKALQKYGGIVTDRSNGLEVEGESSAAIRRAGLEDPWTTYLNGTADFLVMKNFPWKDLEVLPVDYGKP